MEDQPMDDATIIVATNSATGTQTPLGLPRRVVVVGWLLVTLLVGGIFTYGLTYAYDWHFRQICGPTSTAAVGWTRSACATFFNAADVVYFTCFLILSVFLFWRKPGERMATVTAMAMLLFGAASPTPIIQLMQSADAYAWLGMLCFLEGMWALLLYFFLFPDGRYVPRWTHPIAWLIFLSFAVWLLVPAFNPFLNWSWNAAIAIVLLLFAVAAFAQIVRYRHYATPAQQQQTKIVIFGSTAALLGYASVLLLETLFQNFSGLNAWSLGLATLVFYALALLRYVTLLLIPISLTISVLRYRLWEIDLVISRTLAGSLVTAVLVVVFLVDLLITQRLLAMVAGGEQSGLSVAVSSLVVALAFNPVRQRLTRFIDKRFYPKYLEKARQKEQEIQVRYEAITPGNFTRRQFGVYEVQDLIGRGGMAEVYRGKHTQLDRLVAIKILPSNLADQEAFRMRFEREAQTVARLRHPNIVQLFDFGVQDHTYYMVMEYLAGHTLAQRIQAGAPVPLAEALPILKGLAEALDYAHQQGIVHRDVKPSNIILQPITTAAPNLPTIRPILMDFGIARILESSSGLTSTGTLGTLDYIAPEQILSSSEVDGRADVYALGVIAYQMLTGKLPFTGDNAGALVLAHLQKTPVDPRKLNPSLDESTARAILHALAKEPQERYKTAGEFGAALYQPLATP
jgi:tRNA A-37 threonylcarbamoyl transferase component Bud32